MYEDGRCSDKKRRYQPEVIKAYAKCIYRIEEALNIEGLYQYRSLKYEVLKGKKKGISSVRVNDKYRIEFKVSQLEEAEPVTTICTILELTNHYE
jgi:proteic killer suppression protein